MRTIRIDEDVWRALQARATDNLRDTPNRVLRRLLGLNERKPAEAAEEQDNGSRQRRP